MDSLKEFKSLKNVKIEEKPNNTSTPTNKASNQYNLDYNIRQQQQVPQQQSQQQVQSQQVQQQQVQQQQVQQQQVQQVQQQQQQQMTQQQVINYLIRNEKVKLINEMIDTYVCNYTN